LLWINSPLETSIVIFGSDPQSHKKIDAGSLLQRRWSAIGNVGRDHADMVAEHLEAAEILLDPVSDLRRDLRLLGQTMNMPRHDIIGRTPERFGNGIARSRIMGQQSLFPDSVHDRSRCRAQEIRKSVDPYQLLCGSDRRTDRRTGSLTSHHRRGRG
jgi:hypothetical protein